LNGGIQDQYAHLLKYEKKAFQ
jgi:hypothetical protein